jgi:HlyD family secretion protein
MIFARAKKPAVAAVKEAAKPAPRPVPVRPARRKRPELRVVPPAPNPAVLEYQTDAIEIETRKPPALARITLYAVVLFIGAAIYWASVSDIDEIVVAPGKLITTEPTLVVQPLETSVIRSIAVQPGDVVKKGQLLAILDPTFSKADVDQLTAHLATLDAQIARIRAELADQPYVIPATPSADEATQAQLYQQRAAAYRAKIGDYDAQISHAEATLASSLDQERVLEQRIAGLGQIDDMRSALAATGNGSKLNYLQSRDVNLDTQVTLSSMRGTEQEARMMVRQLTAERQNYIEDYRRQSLEQLVDLSDKRASAAEDLRKAQLRQAMALLTSPADAAVLDVAQRSIGSVATAAEPLFTLVPLNVPLEAEVSVAARDIGHLAQGNAARIKFDAFPFQKYGTISGTVTSISHDSFASQPPGPSATGSTGGAGKPSDIAFYKVHLSLGATPLHNLPSNAHLMPGMTIQVEIDAGKRSIMSYFLYPLIRGLDESLHEP